MTAKTEEDVRRKAQAFWDKELARLAPGKKAAKKGVGQTDVPAADDVGNADAGLDEDGPIPGDKGARPVATTDDLDDLLG